MSISEKNRATDLFETAQALYKYIEDAGDIQHPPAGQSSSGNLVNTLV